ncbi:deoxynucleoside triphosphate triphosphohydrolase SAMHD1-like [Biomphalaria glabrata]|uniref:Deoxynucleoside triphosphate triphosphohydrolase SAMHD1-like n=1 Tax=Biomphalaria glabrata TaxID=6526 RepID=A0A9W3AUK5_BIOGL|nr:deoxynucleoside triphosphate triphosphohydrolase SAMHD1-like [Biomphalaria glabrata]XP_055890985.1 deoxynucleoside triphosphate triphosphohydrolase SAMHD1-like [Biomphalaria glabrata]XP_055890986.1 deoxynucleoside triphosphate triphosphohydrolase SAMHD1-like [Biomphalaria glabrata]XP_055890987.1 deoxynucleoside triphosphate triphosphohydrolase SAMHD1-like [Biomphalaria glabrata]KAI8762459.1 deoxynucleoside triphosphate triphosphohydrolase SAMHD1-like [Biomphalaria glabrata]
MATWLDKPLEEMKEDLSKRDFPKELQDVLEKLESEAKRAPLLKHIKSSLTAYELMKNGVKSYQDCLFLFEYLSELEEMKIKKKKCKSVKDLKIFNDPIHGHIQLHPACQMIVDTPEFQRLRDIKQLGTVYFVYPGAAHNRFEHSLGVCHLAGQFTRALRESQPELGITDVDILCVEIAGLCRDIGHGPFSRLYVSKFLPAINKDIRYRKPSAQMFEHLLRENDLKVRLQLYGLEDVDIQFIKEQLEGAQPTGSTAWPYTGRTKEKAYLYEIIVNNRNGIDVYKWDYLARDCHHLGIKNNFDPSRYMKFARVIEAEGEIQICIRDKEISNLYNMFYTRYTVNKFAYFHRVTCGIELMIIRAFVKANNHIRYKGKEDTEALNEDEGRPKSLDFGIYDCHKNMAAFTKLTDSVLFTIRTIELPDKPPEEKDEKQRWEDLKEAKEIIERIFHRDLFTCVYESQPRAPKDLRKSLDIVEKTDIEETVFQKMKDKTELGEQDIIVKVISLHFGMKEENPVERLKVYSKQSLNEARHLKKEEASRILGPVNFNEVLVRIYSTLSKYKDKDLVEDRSRLIRKAADEILEVKPDPKTPQPET